MAPTAVNEASSASLLSIFHEDILLCILGFVADVPFEVGDASGAEEGVWEEGLQRLIFDAQCRDIRQKLAELARSGAGRRDKRTRNADIGKKEVNGAQDATNEGANSAAPRCSTTIIESKHETLLENARKAMEEHPPENHTATSSGIYQCIYRSVLQHHIRYQAPVFYMPSSIRLGVEYGLHFFEPRYRLLISEVMSTYGVAARRGERIQPVLPGVYPTTTLIRDESVKIQLLNFLEANESILRQHHTPTFIHAHQSPLGPNTPATIVKVKVCQISPNGSADVFLEPVAYIWLERIWERPGTGGLIEARGIRMEKNVGMKYEMWCGMSAFGNGDGRGRGLGLPIP
ncbi:hypothetical protein ACHAWO_003834 [Cyclotella atomus]|uniref:Uncharacterized protein n=1 Tax=Cyclotella atomus TaxID=382360 RepID=A0ABD3QRN5_9STRA